MMLFWWLAQVNGYEDTAHIKLGPSFILFTNVSVQISISYDIMQSQGELYPYIDKAIASSIKPVNISIL